MDSGARALPLEEIGRFRLRPAVARLRDAALRPQMPTSPTVAVLPLIDARTWSNREPGEDWLIWRARRTAERLRRMPLEIAPGELVVGRPDLRPPTAREREEIEAARPVLSEIPPFPGGDPGHFHPDYEKLFRLGIGGIRAEVEERLGAAAGAEQETFYRACRIAVDGLSDFVRNVAGARGMDPGLSAAIGRLATEPPSSFRDAIELMFLAMVALWFGEDHGLTTPGRMDWTLRRFYEADLAAGRLEPEEAFQLISCLFIQCNMILGPGSALSVMVGGRDREGRDLTCDLTYLCLASRAATRLVYPTVGLAWHAGTPGELTDYCCAMLASGIGDPAFFNDELISEALRDHGVSAADSSSYMNSTCVEIKVVGASHMWVTAPYFNCPKALLEAMEEIAAGAASGEAAGEPADFEGFKERVKRRLERTVRETALQLDGVWRKRSETGCFPLASCLINDCLERGLDFDRGGARYAWVENSFVGLANLVDSLLAVKHVVYAEGELSIARFHEILARNFDGCEDLRARLANRLPSYGCGDPEADELASEMAAFLEDTTEANTVGPHRYVPGFFCWIIHEQFGSQTGATPDGRRAGLPLADGAGASQGREKAGPTASVLSTTSWSHRRALGGLVHNVRFSGDTFRKPRDLGALRTLIETYLRRGGFEIQVNVVSGETLRDAQTHPERHQDLLVRVAGYSDYFVHLNRNMQDEVIRRNEHRL